MSKKSKKVSVPAKKTAKKTSKVVEKVKKTELKKGIDTTSNIKKTSILKKIKEPTIKERLVYTTIGVVASVLVLLFSFVFIPRIYDNTETAELERNAIQEKKEDERVQANMPQENRLIEEGRNTVKLKTNFGDLKFFLDDDAAPKTVENFLRLTFRDKYDNTIIHRMVKNEGFAIIQGGDYEEGDGSGESANKKALLDEIWTNVPEFDEEGKLLPGYEFTSSKYYTNFDEETGYVTYPKGTIAMANSGSNTARSQFFITLIDTTLPANYTAFGYVDEEYYSTLDDIYNNVTPVADGIETTDGEPNQEIKIIEAIILDN